MTRFVVLISWIVIFMLGCGGADLSPKGSTPSEPVAKAPNPPQPPVTPGSGEKYRVTYYYALRESEVTQSGNQVNLRDMQGKVIKQVSEKFRKLVDIEGTGILLDGRVINYAGRVDSEVRYVVVPHPYGLGVGNRPLKPFCSVAVDPSRIPLDSIILIEETKGMLLPDGSVHDGIWVAVDVGGAIKNDRIDLFIGQKGWAGTLSKQGIGHLEGLTVEKIHHPGSSYCL